MQLFFVSQKNINIPQKNKYHCLSLCTKFLKKIKIFFLFNEINTVRSRWVNKRVPIVEEKILPGSQMIVCHASAFYRFIFKARKTQALNSWEKLARYCALKFIRKSTRARIYNFKKYFNRNNQFVVKCCSGGRVTLHSHSIVEN